MAKVELEHREAISEEDFVRQSKEFVNELSLICENKYIAVVYSGLTSILCACIADSPEPIKTLDYLTATMKASVEVLLNTGKLNDKIKKKSEKKDED